MPNWCYNSITITHEDPAMIQRLVKASENDKILQEFIPCPEDLLEHGFDFTQDDYKEKVNAWEAKNLEKYGFSSWYDWRVENWGTKWDIGFDAHVFDDGKAVSATFDSAWSPPVNAYEKLYEMGFHINAIYHEPGMCYAGCWQNGVDECVEYDFTDPDWRDSIPSDDLIEMMENDYECFLEYENEAKAKEA